MRRLFMVVAVVLISGLLVLPVAAQTGDLYTVYDGIWYVLRDNARLEYSEVCRLPERVTSEPALSPNGRSVAFRVEPLIVRQGIERSGGIAGGEMPGDIALCDLETGAVTLIAVQPPDMTFFNIDETAANYVIRSAPSWSPDGAYVYWTENPDAMRLIRYTLSTSETDVLVENIPLSIGVPVTYPVRVSPAGFAFTVFELLPDSATFMDVPRIYFYAPDGTPNPNVLEVNDNSANIYFNDIVWAEMADGSWQLGLPRADGRFDMIDPVSAQFVGEEPAVLELAVIGQPDGPTLRATPIGMGQPFNIWSAVTPDGDVVPLNYQNFAHELPPAISPSGTEIAVVGEDRLVVLNPLSRAINAQIPIAQPEGSTSIIPNRISLIWAPLYFRESRFPESFPAQSVISPPTECDGLPAPRMSIANIGIVIDTLPNNVRSQPASGSPLLGTIPPQGQFMVLEGPVCSNGYVWWRVDYDGLIGWTAEGDASEYWLEMLPAG